MTLSMDQRRKYIFIYSLVSLAIALLSSNAAMGDNVVFEVKHKYGGIKNSLPSQLIAHDTYRHGRALAASVALPLGGDDRVTDAALYYTKLSIGTPSKDFHVQVDTGSDLMWVNCQGCDTCSRKSSLGLGLQLYDAKASSTTGTITCADTFCKTVYDGSVDGCLPGQPCTYTITYADSSGSQGYFVSDTIKFDQIIGHNKTTPMNGIVSFGCSFGHSGTEDTSTDRVDGIVGFGQLDTSLISQLAFQGKTKRSFSHCLDGGVGGGIFAIGEVMDTDLQITPMERGDHTHYTVTLKEIEINGETLKVPTENWSDFGRKTIIDSGATLAHLPESVYDLVMGKVLANRPNTEAFQYSKFDCLHYMGDNIDRDYPEITLRFKNSATMRIYPHEYLLQINDRGQWCIGWQKGGMKNDEGSEMIILGDIVLSNKLVVYDIENQTIGWREYDCTSSIKVKDEDSGEFYTVQAHIINPSSATRLIKQNVFTFLMTLAIIAAMLLL